MTVKYRLLQPLGAFQYSTHICHGRKPFKWALLSYFKNPNPFILFLIMYEPGGTGFVVSYYLPVGPDRRPAGLPSRSVVQSPTISKKALFFSSSQVAFPTAISFSIFGLISSAVDSVPQFSCQKKSIFNINFYKKLLSSC